MKHCGHILCVLLLLPTGMIRADDKGPQDSRLGKPRDLNGYFPFTPPPTKEAWESRRKELRLQVLVATGLWPMPEKQPLNAVVHGKIDRDEYTIEKVYFASYPGLYVTGNLYRPKMASGGRKPSDGKRPAVLIPHGHWNDGRFYDAGEKTAQAEIKLGAEKSMAGARYPLQAPCVQLARMGCVVFHYDMIGYADSKQLEHRKSFVDADSQLRLHSEMGIQTWNSIRALDFLESLPDVDAKRIGVTGASGGGTQTFILCAVDDRPAAAFPAVMVSTAMQGGCVCENCSYLRQDTGNVGLAALFAPKPLGMTGADDWTREIETKGLPELKVIYRLYGAEDKVMAKCLPQFKHNYNQVSREIMYGWFNKHLQIGLPEPIVEKTFEPVPSKELSVFDEQHPRPKDALDEDSLRTQLAAMSDRQMAALLPKNAQGLKESRRVLEPALRVMIHDTLPKPDQVQSVDITSSQKLSVTCTEFKLSRKDLGERVPAKLYKPAGMDTVVVWIHPEGGASLAPQPGENFLAPLGEQLFGKKIGILAIDVFQTGAARSDKPPAVDKTFAGFTFGYNRPLLAERVHDILTAVAYARGIEGVKKVHLIGFEKAGPWVLLARALSGDAVDCTVVDLDRFRFENVRTTGDEMMLPGALKYGGISPFIALIAPHKLCLHNQQGTGAGPWLKSSYEAAGAPNALIRQPLKADSKIIFEWLSGKD